MIIKKTNKISKPIYLSFGANKLVHRTEEVRDGVLIDYDSDGHVIGIEILQGNMEWFEESGLSNQTSVSSKVRFVQRD